MGCIVGREGGIREASALQDSERRKLGYILYGELAKLRKAATKIPNLDCNFWLLLQCSDIR
jgi:hypothetical protein